jgi:YHS domain-containing protein
MNALRSLSLALLLALAGSTVQQGCTPYMADPENLRDPVCGRRVDKSHAFLRLYDSWEYYFDSEDCANKFDRHPARYVDMVHYVLENQDGG